MMQYYFENKYEEQLCQDFESIVFDYPFIHFFQPSEKQPRHVQAHIHMSDGTTTIMNFWPHKMRGQIQGLPSVDGTSAIRALLDEALKDAINDIADVIEAQA